MTGPKTSKLVELSRVMHYGSHTWKLAYRNTVINKFIKEEKMELTVDQHSLELDATISSDIIVHLSNCESVLGE